MKKRLIILLFFIFLFYISNAQIFENDECAVGSIFNFHSDGIDKKNAKYLDSLIAAAGNQEILYRIPIKFWVYQKSNGTLGVTTEYLKKMITALNQYYTSNKTGIYFYMIPEVSYINSSRLFDMGYLTGAPLQMIRHKEKGCLNVFIPRMLSTKRFGKDVRYYQGTYNSIIESIILIKDAGDATFSHEVGHFLGLDHPHKNSNKGKRKQESVSRTRMVKGLFRKGLNCELNGDRLADTPAEPNMTGRTDRNCVYVPGATDRWGELYKPNVNNIMSYSGPNECRTNFTIGQKEIILSAASNKKYSSDWSSGNSNSKLYELDIYEPDNVQDQASEILVKSPQIHTFHRTYRGFKKRSTNTDMDWLYFNIKSDQKQNILITVSKGKNTFPGLKLSISDKFSVIKTAEINDIIGEKESKIRLDNLSKGKYFIQIEKKSQAETLSDYTITIEEVK